MSTYTITIWEMIKSYNDYEPAPIPELIEKYRSYIFDFDYEVPNNVNEKEFKKWFETTFISKFAQWEIGFYTFEQFHLQLFTACQTILPSYAKKIELFLNLKPRDFYTGKWGTEESEFESTNNSKSMNSTLPINMINSNTINDVDYADSANKNESQGNNTNKIVYDYVTSSMLDRLHLFDKSFGKIYKKLFDEFNYLFLGVM